MYKKEHIFHQFHIKFAKLREVPSLFLNKNEIIISGMLALNI